MMNSFPMDAPRSLPMPQLWQQGALIVIAVALALCTTYALWRLIRQRDPLLLLALIGGALAILLEPIADVLGQAYHPEVGQLRAFTLMGRGMPWHIALIYPLYFGLYCWLLIRAFDRGISRSAFWKLFGYSAAFAFLVEVIPVHVGLWKYYGEQPFVVHGMPLWWYVANPTSIIGAGTLSWLGIRDRQGWARWPLIVLIPVAGTAVHTGVSAPIYMGLNSMNTATDNILPGLITIAFAFVMLSVFQRWVVREQPVSTAQRAAATARDSRSPALPAAAS